MFRFVLVILTLVTIPFMLQATEVSKRAWSGTWFVYGFALYQPIKRTETPTAHNKQIIHATGFDYGIGVGKDHVRVEWTRYMNKSRFLAAYDILTQQIATPYVGYVYGSALKNKDNSGLIKTAVVRSDAIVGITFQPTPYFSVYAEYLLRDSFFFAGARIRLPYKIN